MRFRLVLAFLAGALSLAAADAPRVLILGDSISIGYTPAVTRLLEGKAAVNRPKANCGSTQTGLAGLEQWLGDGRWDVIHFNWGLHDLCYRHPDSKVQGNRDKVNGKQVVPTSEYERNLETLVARLQRTGARLVFANTTLVPEGEAGRFTGDEVKYNAIAERVMQRQGIPVNDLHALTRAFGPELFKGPGDVHFTPAGYARLAAQVAAAIEQALRGGALPR
jgi:lysophospholipase L1-like esterase